MIKNLNRTWVVIGTFDSTNKTISVFNGKLNDDFENACSDIKGVSVVRILRKYEGKKKRRKDRKSDRKKLYPLGQDVSSITCRVKGWLGHCPCLSRQSVVRS